MNSERILFILSNRHLALMVVRSPDGCPLKLSIEDIGGDVKVRGTMVIWTRCGQAGACQACVLNALAPSVIAGRLCHSAQSVLIAAAACKSSGRYSSISFSMLVSAA